MTLPSDNPPLAIEHRAPAALRPDPGSPRAHKPQHVAAIARSIQSFGFNMPVAIDAERTIVAGHGRVLAALKLGLERVPVIRLDHLSADQRRAYMIADNRLTDASRWDERLLGEVLRDLTLAELDFELDAIGFSVAEIDLKIDALVDRDDGRDDAVPEAGGPAVAEPGDLWRLGRHRLLCGDARSPAAWTSLMAGVKAAMAFTDPPYNAAVRGHVSGLGRARHREFVMASGEMDRDRFTAFLRDAFANMAAHCVPSSLHYVCVDWRHVTAEASTSLSLYPPRTVSWLDRNQLQLGIERSCSRTASRPYCRIK